MNLFLIGYRCTGKTSVGKLLARRLNRPFVDLDERVVATAGISIAAMVAASGWLFFRAREREALETVATGSNQVVSPGGGVILDPRNVATMKRHGVVVWLTATRETIAARLMADPATAANRPSLTDRGLMEEIDAVLAERVPLYQNAADLTITTDHRPIDAVVQRIIDYLEEKEDVQ
ncbi:Shikimate kinase [Desulfosarcina cetonica]|uniref:shikimate kinase AroL n=1 Tax=Desulfosarcina cetonica TaxID=90730 RepID=UPI0006D1BF53|nr:shikimate kinase AroL [Desulfosarcina cetonica]VTR69432.1 Shikimate kinase [Desulfosarcina cetonica]